MSVRCCDLLVWLSLFSHVHRHSSTATLPKRKDKRQATIASRHSPARKTSRTRPHPIVTSGQNNGKPSSGYQGFSLPRCPAFAPPRLADSGYLFSGYNKPPDAFQDAPTPHSRTQILLGAYVAVSPCRSISGLVHEQPCDLPCEM